ncbi:hypothetical protein ACOMHN_028598 [Nucella lapillus]
MGKEKKIEKMGGVREEKGPRRWRRREEHRRGEEEAPSLAWASERGREEEVTREREGQRGEEEESEDTVGDGVWSRGGGRRGATHTHTSMAKEHPPLHARRKTQAPCADGYGLCCVLCLLESIAFLIHWLVGRPLCQAWEVFSL